MARHQRPVAVEEQIVGLGPVAAADDVDVARAAVTIRPVLAPLRSISVLIAMVEPWISSSMAAASSPLLRMQSMMPWPSSRGVVRLLASTNLPALSSKPIEVGESAADVDGDDDHCRASRRRRAIRGMREGKYANTARQSISFRADYNVRRRMGLSAVEIRQLPRWISHAETAVQSRLNAETEGRGNARRVCREGRGHHGGSRGIGREIAAEFAREGAQTVIVSSSAENLAAASKTIAAAGGPAPVAIAADLRTLDGCRQVFERVKQQFNACDILVCSAGATRAGNFVDLPDEAWMDGYALKLFGCVRMCRLFWPMLKAAQGFVVNIGGGAARSPGADFSIGASVNAAMGNFSKALSQLGKRDGVNVNVIHPGRDRDRALLPAHRTALKGIRQISGAAQAGSHGARRRTPSRQTRRCGGADPVSLFGEGASYPGHRHRGRWRRHCGILLIRGTPTRRRPATR